MLRYTSRCSALSMSARPECFALAKCIEGRRARPYTTLILSVIGTATKQENVAQQA